MPSPDPQGTTLWEMFTARLGGRGNGNGAGAPLALGNPLDLRVDSAVLMAHANGPDFEGCDFSVKEIREYLRQINGQPFVFTDYVLHGVNRKTFDANDQILARLRVLPNPAGGHDSLLLRLDDEFAFAEDFLGVVKDVTGIFEATDDASGVTQTFSRINDLRESYAAIVLVVSATTPDGKAPPAQTAHVKIEYWDYWRDLDPGAGGAAKEFLFVEMNSDTGWFQIWRGREFFS